MRACGRPDSVHLNGDALSEGSELPGFAVGAGRLHVRFEDVGGGQTLEVEPAP